MDNYIVINGKKAELNEEQLQALGIEVKKKRNNPFNSNFDIHKCYYFINAINGVLPTYFDNRTVDGNIINSANSFNDKAFANQVYLHELLNRKLLKYAWDNEAEADTIMFENKPKYYIAQNIAFHTFTVLVQYRMKRTDIYFSKKNVAEQAIKDVIEPFMKEHPEFVW